MKIAGDRWKDEEGRRLILRGVNLGGDSKVPVRPDGATHLRKGFYDRRGVCFVGRPFPLDEADAHLGRLKRWGMNFLRLLVTWEAVEHDGPGVYDEDYLDYIEAVAAKAGEQGLSLFIDPHQDVWSRWTGGDGAPIWTLEAAGFAPERLQASGAAMVHEEMGDDYPRMEWFTNHGRLACFTMFSLFFGGNTFAPGVEARAGESIQDFLQGRYLAAMRKVAERVARLSNVVGFDSLNEPGRGLIGHADLGAHDAAALRLGPSPTPWQAIMAGAGYPVDVDVYRIRGLGFRPVGRVRLGAQGLGAWRDGGDCIWRRAGVWDLEAGRPVLRRPSHFAEVGGRAVDFTEDFFKPFVRRFSSEIRAASAAAGRFAVFVEGVPNAERPRWTAADPGNVVDATHWYDDLTLGLKRWTGIAAYDSRRGRVVLGPGNVRRYFRGALKELRDWSRSAMGGVPTILGEFGLPFDLNGRRAYRALARHPGVYRRGDYRLHEKALSAYYDAVDANLLDSTLWNYSARNRHGRGDLWNGEDLSVFCADEAAAGRTETGDVADAGGRALRGFVRPYARRVAGDILEMRFDPRKGDFVLRYRPDPAATAPTEIFVPQIQYPRGYKIEIEGGASVARDEGAQAPGVGGVNEPLLYVRAVSGATAEVRVRIRRR